jgi:putative membrane protein
MVTLAMSGEERALVTAAVAEAELRSAGEIVTIVSDRSDSYHDVMLHYAVLLMLFVPVSLALVPQSIIDWVASLLLGWNATLTRPIVMLFLFVKLIGAFLLVRILLSWMPLRMALTPGSTKTRRVRRRAVQLFKVTTQARTTGRTGILLYLSLLERRAEIVADEAIHSKVEPEVWGDAMAALVAGLKQGKAGQGMADAVRCIGDVLAKHLPRSNEDVNELPDRIIEA